MTSKPTLLSLFWRAEVASQPTVRQVRVALNHLNVLDELEPVPAVLLYPAFLTPAVHVEGSNEGMFELLLLARSSPPLTASDVNLHLKMTEGLDPFKCASNQPLFASAEGNVFVQQVTPDGNGTLATPNVFRGQLDRRIVQRLKEDPATDSLDAYYAVRVRDACLKDPAVIRGGARTATADLQDRLVMATLLKMNGPALRGQEGRGLCCFSMGPQGSDLSKIDRAQPIVAYHPLCFYSAGRLAPASFGHVADMHINARQHVLSRTPARVIDDPRATGDSPPVGGLMNVYEQSFHGILQALGSDPRMDVLLAGGDYVDHARNLYPYPEGQDPNRADHPTARQVWELMDVRAGHGYETNYQAFVDLICLFGELRWFCDVFSKPVFSVTGNHDCYDGAYGISPRVTWVRANAGIPADHNLTFYEAILAFGESFDHLQKLGSPFDEALFEWYFTVFTPFSDFAVALPNQEVIGLAWGEAETSVADAGGQGLTHLPRADGVLTEQQWGLFNGRRSDKKTVLFSHFTFVSYKEHIPEQNRDPNARNEINTEGRGLFTPGHPFSEYDMGTYYEHRPELYAAVADAARTQFVISGHSHRRAVYRLGSRRDTCYATEMHAVEHSLDVAALPNSASRTPILVSDSSGPTPRRNVSNEFGAWGSDCPSGTLISVSGTQVQTVEAIAANHAQGKPRLAVALDYAHAVNDAVFEDIETLAFPSSEAKRRAHSLRLRFKEGFAAARFRLVTLVLYCRAGFSAPWRQIPLTVGNWERDKYGHYYVRCRATTAQAANFFEWLTMPPMSGRFLSMRFSTTDPSVDPLYEQESAWNLQVDCRPALSNLLPWTDNSYVIIPRASALSTRPWNEVPDFAWRRRFPEYQ